MSLKVPLHSLETLKDGQVHVLVHDFADGVLERAWDQLVLQGDGEHNYLLVVAGFVFCHGGSSKNRTPWL